MEYISVTYSLGVTSIW